MNSEVFKGKFNQIKGALKSKWGQITDDEWTQIAGDKDRMIGKLQEKYGRNREEITREVEMFLNQVDRPTTGQPTGSQQGQQGFARNAGHEADMKPGDRKRKVS
jgi:uncharacterized protein YjbJ (UPF0337 family)